MNIRTKKIKQELNLKDLFYDINNILNNWIGSKFNKINETRKQIRVNGKRKELYNYKIDYKKIYKDDEQDLSILDIVRKSSYYDKNK